MTLEEHKAKILEKFDKKSEDVFIGFSDDGEYNNYLNEIDEEGLKFIKTFLSQAIDQTADITYENVKVEEKIECDICYGDGLIWKDKHSAERGEKQDFPCPTCKGTGKIKSFTKKILQSNYNKFKGEEE